MLAARHDEDDDKYTVWMSNSSLWAIDKTLSGATNGTGSDDIDGVFYILQSSSITEASSSYSLMSYPWHLLGGGSYPLCRDKVGVFYSPSRLHQFNFFTFSTISISYLKQYNCVLINDYYQIETIIWNHIKVSKVVSL